MSETKSFHLGDLLSVTQDKLVSPNHIGGVYAVVDFVTGQPHWTHQLPRACGEVRPELLRQHPWLDGIIPPDSVCDEPTVLAWLAEVVTLYGEVHEVAPMPPGAYVGREPISELGEMIGRDRVIPVVVPGEPE